MRLAGALLSGSLIALLAACGGSASNTVATGPDSGSPAAGASSPAASSVPGITFSASPAISPRASVPGCATAALKVTLGTSNGAAGSVYLPIDFTNTGIAVCTLYGYPGVSLTGGSPLAQIGAAAGRNPQAAATVVTLAPGGGVAHATLQVTVAGNYPAGTCQPTAATTLVIYPPGQTAAASVPYATTGCKSTSVTILHVEVVQPGA